jgi:hypothetical protein
MRKFYPWWQVAIDIQAKYNLPASDEFDLATDIARAISEEEIKPLSQSGMPIKSALSLPFGIENNTPYLTVVAVNGWFKNKGYPYDWEPISTRGAPKLEMSLRGLNNSGRLATDAKNAAQKFNTGDPSRVTRRTVARELKKTVYKYCNFSDQSLMHQLKTSMWE